MIFQVNMNVHKHYDNIGPIIKLCKFACDPSVPATQAATTANMCDVINMLISNLCGL